MNEKELRETGDKFIESGDKLLDHFNDEIDIRKNKNFLTLRNSIQESLYRVRSVLGKK